MKEQLINMKRTTNPARNGFISFNDDEMSLYLRKINSIPSLTSEEEKEVAQKYQKLKDDSKFLSDSLYIYYFATMFLKFFDTQESVKIFRKKGAKHSIKERVLISRLIYFTKLSKKEFWLTDDEILKSFLKQYKESDFWNRTSNIYPEFL